MEPQSDVEPLSSLRSRALRLDLRASELRALVRTFGGSANLRAEAERLTLDARRAWNELRRRRTATPREIA